MAQRYLAAPRRARAQRWKAERSSGVSTSRGGSASTSTYATRPDPADQVSRTDVAAHLAASANTRREQHRMPALTAISRETIGFPVSRQSAITGRMTARIDARLIAQRHDHDRVDLSASARTPAERRRRPSAHRAFSTMLSRDPPSAARTAAASVPTTTISPSVAPPAPAPLAARRNAVERRDELLRSESARAAGREQQAGDHRRRRTARATARCSVSSGNVAHLRRAGGGSPSSAANSHRRVDRQPRRRAASRARRSVSSDADAMHSAHASAVNRASVDRRRSRRAAARECGRRRADSRLRPTRRRRRSGPRFSRMAKMLEHHARGTPSRTLSAAHRDDLGQDRQRHFRGALPPRSRPIGVCTRASSSSVNPSSRSRSRIAAPRFLLPSIPM